MLSIKFFFFGKKSIKTKKVIYNTLIINTLVQFFKEPKTKNKLKARKLRDSRGEKEKETESD